MSSDSRESNGKVPQSVDEVIDLFRQHDLLEELDLSPTHAGTMKTRGRIPGHWHVKMAEVARRHGLPVTYELLARLAAKPKADKAGAQA
jgi:hypothetical protein